MFSNLDIQRDYQKLDKFHNHNFAHGISDREVIINHVTEMCKEMDGKLSHSHIAAETAYYVFENAAIDVIPYDPFGLYIAGNVTDRSVYPYRTLDALTRLWEPELYEKYPDPGHEIRAMKAEMTSSGALWCYPDFAHSKPNWVDILALGLLGLQNRVKEYRDKKIAEFGEYKQEHKDFYEPIIRTYDGLMMLVGRYIELAKERDDGSDVMKNMIVALEQIQYKPPRNLYEVLLLTYFYHFIQEHVVGVQTRTLGVSDKLWRPYYEKDLADGLYTRDEIKELFKYFYYCFEYQGHPHGQPLHMGGTNKDGTTVINDLSYLLLEAYEEVNIISPKIQLAIAPNTPDEFILKACRMIRDGHTSIVFCNEEVGRDACRIFTDNEDDLYNLSLSGCYNFSLLENVQAESVGTSYVKGIELALNGGCDPTTGKAIGVPCKSAEEIASFDEFVEIYFKQTYHLIDCLMKVSDFYDVHMDEILPCCMFNANHAYTLEVAKDVYKNGSKYHNTVITISCLASCADSLYAIKKYVFDRKELKLSEMRDILRSNWEGHEALRLRIAKDTEKYGNNLDAPDSLAKLVMDRVADYIASKNTPFGSPYGADGEGITHGIVLGKKTGATPDGRLAGTQLSKNLMPVFGCDTRGVTAFIESVTKIDARKWPNGAPIDYMLHPSAVQGDEGLNVMLALVRTTFKKGGSAIQGNITNAKILKAAQKEPDKYKGLQVRLCGWSQYFNRLKKDEQDMMILQAESVK
ncbi:MAG: hypothetical protein IKU43_11455 [Clostridia bacterium]|nr:hypothetical protein [Clostridia bacterium]